MAHRFFRLPLLFHPRLKKGEQYHDGLLKLFLTPDLSQMVHFDHSPREVSVFMPMIIFKKFRNCSLVFPNGGPRYAGISHKSRSEISWNSCSRQVYPITQDARLIYHAITPIFTNFTIHVFTSWNTSNNAITLSPWGAL